MKNPYFSELGKASWLKRMFQELKQHDDLMLKLLLEDEEEQEKLKKLIDGLSEEGFDVHMLSLFRQRPDLQKRRSVGSNALPA